MSNVGVTFTRWNYWKGMNLHHHHHHHLQYSWSLSVVPLIAPVWSPATLPIIMTLYSRVINKMPSQSMLSTILLVLGVTATVRRARLVMIMGGASGIQAGRTEITTDKDNNNIMTAHHHHHHHHDRTVMVVETNAVRPE